MAIFLDHLLDHLNQGRPTQCRRNYIVSLQKIAVRDLFTLGLEQIVIKKLKSPNLSVKKLAKVGKTIQKEKYFEKIVHFVLNNSTQIPIT